jgi:ATP-independent RNA helicase DbpA
VGKINVHPFQSFVAVDAAMADIALRRLEKGRIKGRKFRVKVV